MRYYKVIVDGYILFVGEGDNGTEIEESEYEAITQAIKNAPVPTEGYSLRLKTDLTWEEIPVEAPIDPEIPDEEAFDIIMGGAS